MKPSPNEIYPAATATMQPEVYRNTEIPPETSPTTRTPPLAIEAIVDSTREKPPACYDCGHPGYSRSHGPYVPPVC